MNRKLFFIPLIILLLLISSCAHREYIPQNRETAASYIFNGNSQSYELYSFTAGSDDPEEFSIPDSYDDGTNGTFPVTKIRSFAFYNLYTAKKVIIPNTIITIERGAFYNCPKLTTLIIPKNVKMIEESAFVNCPQIESITVSEENERYASVSNCLIDRESHTLLLGCNNSAIPQDEGLVAICDHAFYGCDALSSVTFPDTLHTLGTCAFCECTSLSEIKFGTGLEKIGDRCFYGCAFGYIRLPDGIQTIGKGAFSHCEQAWEITLGKGLVYLMEESFSYCSSLHSITIPRSVNYIGIDFVRGCSDLKWIYFSGKDSYWYTTENREEWISGSTRGLKSMHTSQSINGNATAFASTDLYSGNREKIYLIRGEDTQW